MQECFLERCCQLAAALFTLVSNFNQVLSTLLTFIIPKSTNCDYIKHVLCIAGGAPDLSKLPVGSVSGLPVPFKGCIRQLSLNWDRTALDRDHITAARNIADCDGTGCGGDVCEHGGSCWLDNYHDPHCTCPQV